MDDYNHPKLDDYCSFLFYIETKEPKLDDIAYHEKITNMDDYKWSKFIHFWNQNIPQGSGQE